MGLYLKIYLVFECSSVYCLALMYFLFPHLLLSDQPFSIYQRGYIKINQTAPKQRKGVILTKYQRGGTKVPFLAKNYS